MRILVQLLWNIKHATDLQGQLISSNISKLKDE